MQGKIIKGVGGFYYVHVMESEYEGKVFECKAKGAFRNQKLKPAVGDNVNIDVIDQEKLLGNVVDILPRNNILIRPAVVNVDQAVIIFALSNPEPNYNLLDRFLIMMDRQTVETIICFNKSDLCSQEDAMAIKGIYEKCGYKVVVTSSLNDKERIDGNGDSGIRELSSLIEGKTTVFAGPSGVGKSSILNAFNPNANAKTGAISDKIKRGKHTTRHSELVFIRDNTYIMDTPGFSSLIVDEMEPEDLKDYYNEFAEYSDSCRFNGCVHINEPDCCVKNALKVGNISNLRYNNYCQMYEELKSKRRW